MKTRIVIAGACRTAIGRDRGSLRNFKPVDLLVPCFERTISEAIANAKYSLNHVGEVIVGQGGQSAEAPNIARVAAMKATKSDRMTRIPAYTVQRNCGSGLQAIASAADKIRLGEAEAVLVGGVESMSRFSFTLAPELRWGVPFNPSCSPELIDNLKAGLTDPITGLMMGNTAECVAAKYDVTRRDQDKFAAQSYQRAYRAQRMKKFAPQIVPLELHSGGGVAPVLFKEDEGIRADVKVDGAYGLETLPPIFDIEGTVTGGNACQISDGAASMLVVSERHAREAGMPILAEILGYGFAACEPEYMGMGPAHAIPKVLERAEIGKNSVDFWEINEAFAAQVLACQRQLEIPNEKLNLWGGAIAMGHPVGATGVMLTAKLAALLHDMKKDIGVMSLCIGGGQGGAIVIRRWKE